MAEEAQRAVIGDRAHLAFDFSWSRDIPKDVQGLAWGGLVLWVGGLRHWSGDDPERPVAWTWIDLVEHLARAWGHLLHEDQPPFGLPNVEFDELRSPSVLATAQGADPLVVEDAVHAYQHRHDLAAGLKGLTLPPVWLVREGLGFRLRTRDLALWLPYQETLRVLEGAVSQLRAHLGAEAAPRAMAAFARWDRRAPSRSRILDWRTGLDAERRADWTPAGADPETWWGDPADPMESPVSAAARLSQPLSDSTRRAVVFAVSDQPLYSTPILDDLARGAQAVLDAVGAAPPHQQGYVLAQWLRTVLDIHDDRVSPEELLAGWAVGIDELPPLERELDAVAVWGARHGPAVLLNPKGRHAGSSSGRRATLCHEIAHLLIDRTRHLPVVDVVGGSTPKHLEQRARAFAAEFLLPRETAFRAIAEASSFDDAANLLRTRYGVSNEVLGWQIRNGPAWAILSSRERDRVSRWCRGLRTPAHR